MTAAVVATSVKSALGQTNQTPAFNLQLLWSYTTGAAEVGPFNGRLLGIGATAFTMPRAGLLVFTSLFNSDPVPDGLPGPLQLLRNGAPIVAQFPASPNQPYLFQTVVALAAGDVLTCVFGGGAAYNTHTFSALAVIQF